MRARLATLTMNDPKLLTYRGAILAEVEEQIDVLHRQREDLGHAAFHTLEFKISRLCAEREWLRRRRA